MRYLPVVMIGSVLVGCSANTPPAVPSPQAQARLSQLLAGKAAGPAQSCLPSYRTTNLQVINNNTIAFHDGSRVYLNHMRGGCALLGTPGYTLVTRSFGTGPCSGDIAQVMDLSTGMTVGSCSFGDFIPFTRPRA